MRIKPYDVYFSHDSVNVRFSCGSRILDTFKQLSSAALSMDDIPRMTIARRQGKWHAFNGNRRLRVFRKLYEEGYCDEVEVYETDEPTSRKNFTTLNGGVSVTVRMQHDKAATVWVESQSVDFVTFGKDSWFIRISDGGR